MPNHLHVLVGFANTGKSINKIAGVGKRFIAYEVVKRLKKQGREDRLLPLQNAVEVKDRQRGKQHEVWMDSFDWKECRTKEFMHQKLQYLHNNPCRGKGNLALSPADYEHSSAGFYINGINKHFAITNIALLQDVDVSKGAGSF